MSCNLTKRLLVVGGIGLVLTALCCFTPIVVILLTAIGLGAILGYLDYVLLPALAIFVGMIVIALLWKWRHLVKGKGP